MARPRDKACSLCTLTKPRAAFAAKGENGLQSWCRQCTSEWNRWKRDPKGNKKPGPLSEPKPPEPDRRIKEHQEPAAVAPAPKPEVFKPNPTARQMDSYQMIGAQLHEATQEVERLKGQVKELETQLKLAPKVDAVAESLAAEARDLRNDKARLTRELGTAEADLRRARDRNASLEEQLDLAAKKLNEAYARVGELEDQIAKGPKPPQAVAVVAPEHQITPGPQQPLLSGDHAVVRGDDLMTMIQQLAGAKADAAGFNVERPYLIEKIEAAEAKAKELADELAYKDMELADARAQIAKLQAGTPVEPDQVVTSQEGEAEGPKAEAVAVDPEPAPATFQEVLIPQSVEPDDSTRQYMPVAEAAPDELTEIACDDDEPVGEREGDHLLDAAIALESSSRMDKADLTPKLAETARAIIWKLVDAGWKRDKALKTVVDFAFLLLSTMPSNQAAQNGLLRAIGKILLNPHTAGKFLTGHQYAKRKNPVHRVRAGNYRLDYEIRKDGAVVIVFIGHKADSEGMARQRQINAGQGYLMELGA